MTALARDGVEPRVGGTTPLHLAAGAGELGVVQLLVAKGADSAATDPQFGARPLDWAQFLNQPHIVAWLELHADT